MIIGSTTRYTITGVGTGFSLVAGKVNGTWTNPLPIPVSAQTATGATGLWSSLPSLPPGNWYVVALAYNADGASNPSAPIQITVSAVPSAPILTIA